MMAAEVTLWRYQERLALQSTTPPLRMEIQSTEKNASEAMTSEALFIGKEAFYFRKNLMSVL